MTVRAEDIINSEVWRDSMESIDQQLWKEFSNAPLGDVEAIQKVRFCRWAVQRIRSELEKRMRDHKPVLTRVGR